jgi:hypothetical protein
MRIWTDEYSYSIFHFDSWLSEYSDTLPRPTSAKFKFGRTDRRTDNTKTISPPDFIFTVSKDAQPDMW